MISKVEQLVYVVLGVGVVVLIALPFMPKLPSSWGGSPCAAAALAPDREVAGMLSPGGCRVSKVLPGQTDNSICALYSLTLAERSLVTIDLRSTDFDSHLTLLDAKRSPIDTNDDGGEGRNARIARPLEAGSYLVLAKALGGAKGRYSLRAGVRAGGCPVRTLTLPASVSERFSPGDCPPVTVQGQPPQQIQAAQYRVTVPVRGVLLIELESGDFDSVLRLLNSGYSLITQDDDSGGGRNARIVHQVEPGDYIVLAGPLQQGAGAYRLRVSFTAGGPGGGAQSGGTARVCPLADLPLNRAVSARLDGSDCRVRDILGGTDQAYADQYRVTVPARGTLTIDMRSDDVDSFLILMDSNRNQLARDDDGGEGRNSRITQAVGPGTYLVIANSYGGQSQGAYTVQASFAP